MFRARRRLIRRRRQHELEFTRSVDPEPEMICRVWHGWTSPGNADAYERLLREEVFRGIAGRGIAGYQGIELLRRNAADEVEFVTMMWFESLDAVRTFAGSDYEIAVVPPAARAILNRFDARSSHYEVRIPRAIQSRQPATRGTERSE